METWKSEIFCNVHEDYFIFQRCVREAIEWSANGGVNVQLLFQRRSGPQSSISWFPEVIIQVAFHDRLAWIVPHLSIKKLDEKKMTLRIMTLPPN